MNLDSSKFKHKNNNAGNERINQAFITAEIAEGCGKTMPLSLSSTFSVLSAVYMA